MTKIKKTIRHDSVSVKATFPNGDVFKFGVNRNRERLECSNEPPLTNVQINNLQTLCKFLEKETNGERIDRLAEVLVKHNSLVGLSS